MRRFFYFKLLFMAIMLLVGTAAVATNKTLTRNGQPACESFNDNWRFCRYGLQPDGGRIDEPKGLEKPAFDDSRWRKLELPHDWAIEGPFRIELAGEMGKLPYKAIGWYRKNFTLDKSDAGRRIYIDFDGAMCYTEVWVNGTFVGEWPYGYNSFRFDLTPYVKFGEDNLIAVKLNTEKFDSRWYSGAGIYRNVWLTKTEQVHVGHWGTFVTTPEVGTVAAKVNVETTIENHTSVAKNVSVETSIYVLDADDRLRGRVARLEDKEVSVRANGSMKVNIGGEIKKPKLWEVDSPNRYAAVTRLYTDGKLTDEYRTAFGVRTIEFTARDGFKLNGKVTAIKGTCNHHDLGALGAAFNLSALKRQFRILREMGDNALRCSHNPPAPEFLHLADKMGFLVMDEAFDAWAAGKRKSDYARIYEQWHEKDLKAMIHRDRNHPCVVLWSIGNEVIEQRGVEITKHLADIARREDSTRPLTAGYNDPDGARDVGAPLSLDVMGINYFYGGQGRFEKDPRYKDMPTLCAETSSQVSTRGFYTFNYDRDALQNYQISSYDYRHKGQLNTGWMCPPDAMFRMFEEKPHLMGEFVWTGFDYLGEPTPYNSDETVLTNYRHDKAKQAEVAKELEELRKKTPPSRSSYFGIVDLAGFPKDRYYLYQSHWRPDYPMAHILPHWTWPERVGQKVPVHVYTSGDEAELFLNGKSLGRKKKVARQDYRLVWHDVAYEPGEIKVVAYKDGKEWATAVQRTALEAATLQLSADRNKITCDGKDLAFITLKVCDAQGTLVPRSDATVKFSVEGPAEIIATDNGDATSFESFQSPQRKAFNGMALAIVRTKKGETGTIRVKAESNGLQAGEVIIKSRK